MSMYADKVDYYWDCATLLRQLGAVK